MFPMTGGLIMGKRGGNTFGPMFSAVGIEYELLSYFFDFDGFDEISGSGDYTFMAWYKVDSGGLVLYSQNTSFSNSANRISINNADVEQNSATYTFGGTENGNSGIVVKKESGVTSLFSFKDGVFYSNTGLSVADVAMHTQRSISNTLTSGITATSGTGEILAIQITDSALSDLDIQTLLENYDVLPSTTQSFRFDLNTSGSSDNGAYPANMTSNTVPSPYVISASFESEPAWRAFDGNFNLRTIIKASGGSGSAGAWLKLDLGSGNEQAIDAYFFRSWPSQGLNSFTVSGSNDDSSYTDLFTGNGANNSNIIQRFTWTNSTTYRYYRITCNSGFNGTQWTHYQSILVDQSKEWISGGGFAKQTQMTFPT